MARGLRGLRGIPDSYDDAVVAVITQLGLSSADAATRADVWCAARRVLRMNASKR